ncbi:HlyD family efflux transporter periplasmic adaptor subunit [Flavonifractor sp. AGMB03687]|uniref:HlyD family efflux transporter periplasmic adaptor subunit n=1 Tax=Flavonifractor sp. AGMB03687 TaxID=2785133 RepID=UPI001AE005F3|nr:HlyD family efflux transporter periplasmic adaptor subunit [Flavonifractor sp. AGMB03687]
MKQGSLNARIIMLLLLGAILLTIGVSAWNSLREIYPTVLAYTYTVSDSMEATGFLVRQESVLTGQGGTVELLPDEGEKVSRGETVALFYQSDDGLTQRQTLQQLLLEQEQLEYALAQAGGSSDSAQLSTRVADAIADLRGAASSGDLTGLESQTLELKSLIYKHSYTFNQEGDSTAALQASLDEVNAQIQTLTAQASQSTSRVTASQSGVFSGLVDGYESLITPDMLDSITPSQLEQLARQTPTENTSAIGKLITNSTWYFACTLPEEEAQRLVEGRTITVRFSRDWSGEVDMEVERMSDPENGKVVVVLSADKFLSDTTLLRRQTVELVFDTVSGIRLPKEALRVEQQTTTDPDTEEEKQVSVTGVYALVGQRAEFKEVTVLAEEDDYILVKAASTETPTQEKKALRAGDKIIISSGELYDGKVIN